MVLVVNQLYFHFTSRTLDIKEVPENGMGINFVVVDTYNTVVNLVGRNVLLVENAAN